MIKAVIIDDDMTTVQGLSRSVRWEEFGIRVVGTAINGKEGLEQIEAHRPDIILTDIFMPVMNGIDMLKALREAGNTSEVIILSGYEDFKYAQSAVKLRVNDYLSKPATLDEIERVLKEAVDKITRRDTVEKEERELRELLAYNLPTTKRQLFKGLLEPGFSQTAFYHKVSDYLKLDLSNRHFSVVLIEFFVNRERNTYRPNDLALFAYAVKNIVDELADPKDGVYVADIQRNLVSVIVAAPTHAKQERARRQAIHVAEELLEHVRSYLKLQVWAAVGSVAEHVGDIPKSYASAVELLASRESMPDKQLLLQEDVRELARPVSRRPIESCQAVVDAMMVGEEELMELRIGELTRALREGAAPSISELREFAIDIVGIVSLALHEHGLQIEHFRPDFSMFKELELVYGIADFSGWLRDLLVPICRAMDERSSQKHRKTIDFIKRYVQQHYAEDITLDLIAEKVYLTRNYLSQIFKQETGENYNGYLTRVRMEKAKELLLTGNYKVFEIAQIVGYKNNAYFSQLFKKHTGYYPSELNK
ncbi:response regulator [Paenibacillus mesophilus]|uniref:response regulator n=1 Tax=Paenibacillus mesophilus TaxID=2582849 RepID=UPI00110E64C9|nr:response regulator [Paenibacillus mesophilus]TMV49427.1 response regulator [Paenibacillus mesophilus]